MTLPIEASPECTQATNAFNEIPVFTQAWQAFEAAITAADPGDDCDLNLNVPVTMTCNFDFNQLVTDFNMVQTCHDIMMEFLLMLMFILNARRWRWVYL